MAFLYICGNFCIQISVETKHFAFVCICYMYVSYPLALPLSPLGFLAAPSFLAWDCGVSGHP